MDITILGITLTLAALWLLVLTFVVVLLIRQLGLITLRLSRGALNNFDFDDDGPAVGSIIPSRVAEILPQLSEAAPTYLIMLSSSCVPCREMASSLANVHTKKRFIALVAGDDRLASGLIALLPPETEHVRDPYATEIAEHLDIKSAPFAVAVSNGTVSQKTFLFQPSVLSDFMNIEHIASNNAPASQTELLIERT